jgi:hypothetical protein
MKPQADAPDRFRPWLFGLGPAGQLIGFALLWTTPSGWRVFGIGVLSCLLGVFTPRNRHDRGEWVRMAIATGFLVLGGLLIVRSAEQADRDLAGSAAFAMVGAPASVTVGLGALVNTWSRDRLAQGRDGALTRFFSRHFVRR